MERRQRDESFEIGLVTFARFLARRQRTTPHPQQRPGKSMIVRRKNSEVMFVIGDHVQVTSNAH